MALELAKKHLVNFSFTIRKRVNVYLVKGVNEIDKLRKLIVKP